MSGGPRYLCPSSLGEASDLLLRLGPAARVVGGGTDLMVELRRGKAAPEAVVDVTRLPELRELREEADGTLRLGAALCHSEVADSPLVERLAPVLARACASVGSVQVRNLGTLGGNAANAAVAADTLPALAVLRARFEVGGPAGTRRLSVDEFFRSPGRTALEPGELLTALLVPLQPAHGAAFLKVGRRKAAAISRLSVAALANPRTGFARLSLGAVFPRPQRVEPAEELLHLGFDEARIEEAGAAAEAFVRRVSGERASMSYKLPVVRAAVARAVRRALAEAQELPS